jgi:anti-anti-sigma factor
MQVGTLIVSSSLDSLGEISDFVVSAARTAGLDDQAVWEVQLAVDEAATNVILHAYGGHEEGPITVQVEVRNGEFVVCLHDRGKPFDPESVPLPDLDSPLEERQTGGLGLFLMRKLMDRVDFHFDEGGHNLVTMSKRLPYADLRIVPLSGRIDAGSASSVRNRVNEVIESGARYIVIDLSEVTFLSSSGLRVLLLLTRDLHKRGSDLRLCAAQPHVAEVFQLTGFDQIFELHPTREAAVESFARK